MGKLILVLIAVIGLLDLGFNTVMSIDRQADMAAASVTEVRDLSFPVANTISLPALAPASASEDVILAESDLEPESPAYVATIAKVRRHKPQLATQAVTRFTPGTTVITIPPPETYSFKTETRSDQPRQSAEGVEAIRRNEIYNQATAAYVQKNDKGSLVGATLKKPWDWIKAVGAKIK